MEEQTVVHPQHEILLSNIKEHTCNNFNELQRHYAESEVSLKGCKTVQSHLCDILKKQNYSARE